MYTEYSHYMLILSVLLALSARQPTFQMVWIMSLFCIVLNLSLFSLMTCYMCGDFSIYTILTNSNANTPLLFKLSATWSNHEGSLLLWCWLFSVFGLLFCYGVQPWTKGRVNGALRSHSHNREAEVGLPHPLICRGIQIYVYLGLFLAVFLLSTSNPFLRIPFLCLNSVAELNPVLQDPILAIHPPCIYAGYVASAVGFSISLSRWANGISLRNWSEMWVQIRVWSVIAWCFFTVGILLGSWWAYHELGWGGWWFWDPVENASLMPWLIGTACIHSVLVPRNNGWTLFMNILIFVLSICGTFFVRSGLLASVHSFATDSTRGLFILCFVCLILAISANYFVRFSLRSTLLFHSHRISPQYSLWTIPPTYIPQRMANVPLPFVHSGTVAPGVLSVSADMLDYRFESPFCWLVRGYPVGVSRRALFREGTIGPKHFIFSRSASKSTSNDSLRASRTTHQKGALLEVSAPNKISIYHAPISRTKTRIEQLLQLQNVLFCTICGVVMCGTVAPICFQALYNRDVSTGAPFFNGLLVPIFIGVLLVLIYTHSVQLRFGSLEPFAPRRGSEVVRASLPSVASQQSGQGTKRLLFCSEKSAGSNEMRQEAPRFAKRILHCEAMQGRTKRDWSVARRNSRRSNEMRQEDQDTFLARRNNNWRTLRRLSRFAKSEGPNEERVDRRETSSATHCALECSETYFTRSSGSETSSRSPHFIRSSEVRHFTHLAIARSFTRRTSKAPRFTRSNEVRQAVLRTAHWSVARRSSRRPMPRRKGVGVVYFISALCVLFLVLFIAVYAAVSVCEAVYALCVCVLFCSVFLSPQRRLFIEGKLDCTYQSLPSRLVAFTRAFHPRSSFLARNMQIAHASVALFISGVLVSNNHKMQFTQIMRSGHEVQLGKLVCCLRGIDHNYGPTYRAICGNIVVTRWVPTIAILFDSGNQFCTESNEAGGKSDEFYISISRGDMEYQGYAGVYPLDRVVPSLAGKGDSQRSSLASLGRGNRDKQCVALRSFDTGQTDGQSPGERSESEPSLALQAKSSLLLRNNEMNIKRPYINGSCGLAKGCERTNEWNHVQQTFCMFPEKRFCVSNEELSTTKVAIHTNFFSDCYANIGAGSAETGWFVTVMHLPYIVCIWLAFGLASIGGFLSLRTLLKTNKLNWH